MPPSKLESYMQLLHKIVEKINIELQDRNEKMFVSSYPNVPGAVPGLSMWFPSQQEELMGPEYSVINRENIIIHPSPDMSEFNELVQAECDVLKDVAGVANNVIIAIFDEPQADASIKRTTFNLSQWNSQEYARKWQCQSSAHKKVLETIKDQPQITFNPSAITSYKRVKAYVPYRCVICKQMAMLTSMELSFMNFNETCKACTT